MTAINLTQPRSPGVAHRDATSDFFKLARAIRENPFALLFALWQEPGLVKRSVERWPELQKRVLEAFESHPGKGGRPRNPSRNSIVKQVYDDAQRSDPGRKVTYYYKVVADRLGHPFFVSMFGRLSEHAVRNIVLDKKSSKRPRKR